MSHEAIQWRQLQEAMHDFDEDDIESMLDDELNIHKRPIIARRLHQRLCKLRTVRERAEIMKALGA